MLLTKSDKKGKMSTYRNIQNCEILVCKKVFKVKPKSVQFVKGGITSFMMLATFKNMIGLWY